ncbi:MAG: DNRLRE domain-containing protein, partial [Calditrichaeota bacterium]
MLKAQKLLTQIHQPPETIKGTSMKIWCIGKWLPVLVFCLSMSGWSQTQVTLFPIKDNTLYEDSTGSLSNGAGEHIFAGKNALGAIRRALLAFNVAENIPQGATITAVTLTLHMSRTNPAAGPRTVSLHRALSDWGEGTSNAPGEEGSGAPATPGDATWLHTFFDTDFWNNMGGDFASASSASQTVADTGFYTWGSTPEMVADVQDWLDNPLSDFGWILIGDESTGITAKRFDSKEDTVASHRPRLTVTYTGPGAIGDDSEGLPRTFRLHQNYPNPFNPATTIVFELPRASRVTLLVFDVTGQKVRTLIGGQMPAGKHRIQWDGTDASGKPAVSGVYFYRLEAG